MFYARALSLRTVYQLDHVIKMLDDSRRCQKEPLCCCNTDDGSFLIFILAGRVFMSYVCMCVCMCVDKTHQHSLPQRFGPGLRE